MDAYIPQYKWKKLIEDSIGIELIKLGFVYKKQTDRSYHYLNDNTEMIISYFHKEIGIDFNSGNKTIHSADIVRKCAEINIPKGEDTFESMDEYFKYLLKIEFLNICKCKPSVFNGDF
jgi:hypothetical protein